MLAPARIWLTDRVPGDTLAFTDARGRQRTFRVSMVRPGGALADGDRNAYIRDGTHIRCRDTSQSSPDPLGPQRVVLRTGDTPWFAPTT